jgi:hypothetical protein
MRKAFSIGCILILSATFAFSQAISGDLVGTVLDKSGAAVAKATVEVANVNTGVKNTTTTNSAGEYRFGNLPVGRYDISAQAQGFSKTVLRGFPIELNKTATARLTLDVGQVAVEVDVSASTPPIDTTTAQISTTYDTRELQDLPTANTGLGVLNLSLLQAGVSSSGGMGAGTGPSVGGQRPRNNNFTVEGVDNNDQGVTGPVIYVPNDAVENFTVMQNQFSPEFGHSTGGQFNTVVKGGTNTFHGRAYEYFQNRNLNAIDYSVANQTPSGVQPTNPRYDNNRFGGQIGGPILKNKLFFFVNFEYNPIGQAAIPGSPILAPTAAGYASLTGVAGVNTNNVGAFQKYAVAPSACSAADISAGVCPTGGTLPVTGVAGGVQVGVLQIVAPNYQNTKALTTSIDYNISDKDQIRGRYIWNKVASIDTAATLPVFFTSLLLPYDLIAISEYHTFSPSLTNELRVGYNRTGYDYTVPSFTFPGLSVFPNLTVDDLGGINVGPDPNAPQYSVQNHYQIVDNMTWTKGAHTMKFGVEYRKYISPQLFIQRARGDYEYNTFNDYVHDVVPAFAERSVGSVGYSGNLSAFYWYVNDNWKVTRNLSLNLGLRYEYTGTPYGWTQQSLNSVANVPGVITFDSPRAPKKDFMPRVGFAWSPFEDGNTSVRGGFGMGYDVLYDNIGTLSRPPQIGSTVDCPGAPSCPLSNFLANGAIPGGGGSGITTYDAATARSLTSSFLPNDVQYPYSMQWNLGVQHVFLTHYTMDVRYVGTRGVHLNVQDRFNVQDLVTPSSYLPTYLSAPSQATLDALPLTLTTLTNQLNAGGNILPRYASAGFTNPIVGFMPYGSSTYHGLQAQVTRRFVNGLQFSAAYTWSHNIDNSTADFFSTVLTPRRPQDFLNLKADRSNSALDHTHRFTLTAVWDVPWFKSASWFKKNIIGNWQFAPVYTYETGEWATVQSAVDANLNGDNASDRAVINPAGNPNLGSGVTALKNTAGAIVAYQAINPNAYYIVAGKGALATGGRNTRLMPAINNWDMSVVKRYDVSERMHLETSLSALNFFNHPQFVAGSINQVNSISRTSTAQKNYLVPNATNFNNAQISFPSNSRTLALGLKFIF